MICYYANKEVCKMKCATVFCDESGNTGANYIDPQQPLYVVAGWWVHQENEQEVSGLYKEKVLDRIGNMTEIKGASLIRSDEGQEAILSFIKAIGQVHCVPLFAVAEKRYCVAGKIVETLLDPVYNPSSSFSFWNDVEKKQDTADKIYHLSDDTLGEFAIAYRELDLDKMTKAVRLISEELNSSRQVDISRTIFGSINHLPQIIDAEVTSGHTIPGKGSNTINMPVFVSYMCNIELLSRYTGVNEVSIFHDNIPEFKETYEWAFKVYGDGPRVDIPLSNGTIIPLGFEFVKNFNTLDSYSSLLIQAADILASSIYSIFTYVYLDKPLTETKKKIGKLLLPATLMEPQCGTMITSSIMNGKLGAAILR